jgi:predicted amidohydrolase YtcJ
MPQERRTGPTGPTTIIENARVYTMDRDMPHASSIALRDGLIVAVGSKEDVSLLPGTPRRIDAGGRAVIPGLIDAHIHLLDYSRSLSKIDLDGVASKQEVLDRVAEKARELGPGRWVLGGGWNNNLWTPPDFPTRQDLDRVAPDNPVYLDRKDLHSCWVNTLALQRTGVTRDTPDPPGAAIGRDESGEPNGMFFESAVSIARRAIEEPPEDPVMALRRGLEALLGMGIVGCHVPEGPDTFGALQMLDAEGMLPLRVVILLPYYRLDEAIRLGLRTGFGSDRLRTGPVKMFSDGSLGSQTAEMLEPYEGMPRNRGIGTLPQEEMEQAVIRAAQAGIPSAIHAIGDAANRRVLDAFEKAREEVMSGTEGNPIIHRIEHAQILHPDDIPRFAALGVVASMQPIHATSDMHAADRLWGKRARYGYAWRSVLDAGGVLAFGSDAPVETPNPFKGIHAAVTRQDANDLPEGGWYPEECLTVEEAVRAYTEAAVQSCPYLPDVTGTLTPGSAADLLILDQDIFSIDRREIKNVQPVATLVGGEALYDPKGMFGR